MNCKNQMNTINRILDFFTSSVWLFRNFEALFKDFGWKKNKYHTKNLFPDVSDTHIIFVKASEKGSEIWDFWNLWQVEKNETKKPIKSFKVAVFFQPKFIFARYFKYFWKIFLLHDFSRFFARCLFWKSLMQTCFQE